jgi:hypothetical protein
MNATQNAALYIVTGGMRARQSTQLLDMPGRWMLYGAIGQMSHELDAGGPLDAPCILPAGATNSTEWCNGRGAALARQTEISREA